MTDLTNVSSVTTFVTRKDEIDFEIKKELGSIFSSKLRVGSLLAEIKEELLGMGETYKGFIEHCDTQYGLSENWVNTQIRVSKFFKDDERFSKMALETLAYVMRNATQDQLETIGHEAGKSDKPLKLSDVKKLLNIQVQLAKPKPIDKAVVTEETNEELEAAIASLPAQVKEAPPAANVEHDNALIEDNKQLRELLQSANELIKQLKEESALRAVKKDLPMLPQFKSKFLCAVLGLTPEQATKRTNVNKAYRELIKVGYGTGHPAFEILQNAKDELITSCSNGNNEVIFGE